MDQQSVELVEAITVAQSKAMAFDLESDMDVLKYSGWWSAIASGGLSVVLATWKATAWTAQLRHGRITLLMIVSPLMVSAGLGAWLNWKLNKALVCKRQQITLSLKQQVVLLLMEHAPDIPAVLARKTSQRAYLEPDDLAQFAELKKVEKKLGKTQPVLIAQQFFAGLGYVLALVAVLVLT